VADQTITKVTETKADVLPKADAPKAPAVETAKAEAPKAQPIKAEPVKAAAPAAPKAEAPVKAAAKASRTIKAAKPAKKKPVLRKAKAARKAVKISKPVRAGVKAIKTGAKSMNTQTKKAAETAQIAADQIKTVFGDVNQRAKLATDKTAKIVEELADITRGNVEAMVASSKVAAKGVETMGQGAAAYSRKSFEDASAAFKSFSNVKSATDFFKLQGDFARSAFDSAVAESARVSETVLKLAGDVAEPLTSRYTVAAERVKTIAA
jgi:phasin family protein